MGPVWAAWVGLRMSIVGTRRARLSAQRESGAMRTRGDLTATNCRNAKTSSQSSAMMANVSAAAVSAEAYFASPGFTLASAASIVTTLSSSLVLSAYLEVSASDAHSVIERAKILRSSPASDSPLRIAASVINGGSRTALQEVQSL